MLCVFIIQRKTVNNREKDHKQSVSFSFFFAEAERPNFCESEREQERKEADFFNKILFLMHGRKNFLF